MSEPARWTLWRVRMGTFAGEWRAAQHPYPEGSLDSGMREMIEVMPVAEHEALLRGVAAGGPCPECGLPLPGPHRGTCSASLALGGPGFGLPPERRDLWEVGAARLAADSEHEALPRSPESNRWVVVAFDFGNTDRNEAALVTAATEEEAAEIGAEMLQREWDRTDGMADLTIEHVFVGPWPRTAYTVTRRFDAETSEWQCCGGPNENGDHYGGCPTRREADGTEIEAVDD